MDISEVKRNLGQIVIYSDSNISEKDYKFTSCILTKNKKNEFIYLAEIQDIHNNDSVIICDLNNIKSK